MQFSVVIPTRNRLSSLQRTVQTAVSQRFADFELIVVDDGSTDGTTEFLARQCRIVRANTRGGQGPGIARNIGAQVARGEYLAFLDSDDIWFPWTLECFAEAIERHARPALLSARLMQFTEEREIEGVKESPLEAEYFADYLAAHATGYFVGACMCVVRRDVFLAAGGFTDKPVNAEDHDLALKVGTARGFVQITAPVTLGWRQHPGSATKDLGRTAAGNHFLVEQERAGRYPGGSRRALERREIIARHTRAAALACLDQGRRTAAWQLYWETLPWHVQLHRWKYLIGFPARALFGW
jgi:GT2 family glycosyltransferase